jgi:hypothetical protein
MNYYKSLVTSWNKPGLLAAALTLGIAFCPAGHGCRSNRHGHFAVVAARNTCWHVGSISESQIVLTTVKCVCDCVEIEAKLGDVSVRLTMVSDVSKWVLC